MRPRGGQGASTSRGIHPPPLFPSKRDHARCACCQQSIPRDVILHVRLGKTYHASCAERVRAAATVKKPTIIGHIYGTARTFDRQGGPCRLQSRQLGRHGGP